MGKNKPLLWTAVLAAAGTGNAIAKDATAFVANPDLANSEAQAAASKSTVGSQKVVKKWLLTADTYTDAQLTEVKQELLELLSVQYNKAVGTNYTDADLKNAVLNDEDLQKLSLDISGVQAKVNALKKDSKKEEETALRTQITTLSTSIAKAVANVEAYYAASKLYDKIIEAAGDIDNPEDETDKNTLAYIYNALDDDIKEAAKSLYDSEVAAIQSYKETIDKAYSEKAAAASLTEDALTEYSNSFLGYKDGDKTVEGSIASTISAIKNGETDELSYTEVNNTANDYLAAYKSGSEYLYNLLVDGAPAFEKKADGSYIYNKTYTEAVAELNTVKRNIAEIQKENEELHAEKKCTSATKEKYLADLEKLNDEVTDIKKEYLDLVGQINADGTVTPEGSYRYIYKAATDAISDISDELDAVVKKINTPAVGEEAAVERPTIYAKYSDTIDEIAADIEALEALAKEANEALGMTTTDTESEEALYFEGYEKAADAIDAKIAKLIPAVTLSVNNWDAYQADLKTIAGLEEDLNTKKSGTTDIKETEEGYVLGVDNMVSKDKKFSLKDKFTGIEATIKADIDALEAAADAAYAALDESAKEEAKNTYAFDETKTVVDKDGKVTYNGTEDIEKALKEYVEGAESALNDYETIQAELADQDLGLNGKAAVGEKGKEGYVEAVSGLKDTAKNTDVTIDGEVGGKSYGTVIKEIEAQIASVKKAFTGAQAQADQALVDSLHNVAGLAKDTYYTQKPTPVSVKDLGYTLAEMQTLRDAYEAKATAWNANQVAAAKATMLEVITKRLDAVEKAMIDEDELTVVTYGKNAETLKKTLYTDEKSVSNTLTALNTQVTEAEGKDASEAIALLSALDKDITALETAVAKANTDAAKYAEEYAAETALNTELATSTTNLNAKLNGGTVDAVEYKGVAAALGENRITFTDEIAAVQKRITDLNTAIAKSYTDETLRKDAEDTTDKDGKVTAEGYKTKIAAVDKAIKNLYDLAVLEVANQKAYDAFTAALEEADFDAVYNNVKAKLNADVKDEEGNLIYGEDATIATGDARDYYTKALETIKETDYNTNVVKASQTAYAASVKSTLDGATSEQKYTNEAKNMVAKTDALNAALASAIDKANTLLELALDNEVKYHEMDEKYNEASATWKELFTAISEAETSSAQPDLLKELTSIKYQIDQFKTDLEAAFAVGNVARNYKLQTLKIDAINNNLKSLNGSWEEDYDAAVALDNVARKNDFDAIYSKLTSTYATDLALIAKMSKLSYAAGVADVYNTITDEKTGIFTYADKMRELKAKANEEYNAATDPDNEEVYYDIDRDYEKTAKDYITAITALTKQYTDAVNAQAATTYTTALTNATGLYDAAKAEIAATVGYTDKEAAAALADVDAVIQSAKSEYAKSIEEPTDFAYELDKTILPAFETIPALIVVDKEQAAEDKFATDYAAGVTLAAAEQIEIADFHAVDGETGTFDEDYETFVEESLGAAAEAWDEIEEGEKYDNYAGVKALLDDYLGTIQERNFGTAEKPDIKKHTEKYWDAYDADQSYHSNDKAYAQMQEDVQGLRNALNDAKKYISSLYVSEDEGLAAQVALYQSTIDGYADEAKDYHDANTSDAKYKAFKAKIDAAAKAVADFYNIIIQSENTSLKTVLAEVSVDLEQAQAAAIDQDDDALLEKVAEFEKSLAGYGKLNDRIYADYSTGTVDEDGVVITEKDKDGNLVPVTITKEEAQERYIALETLIGQTKTELTKIYNEALIAEAEAEIQAGIDGLEETLVALNAQLAECHEPVQAKYAGYVEALSAAIELVKEALEQDQANNTVLLYAENNLTEIAAAAVVVEGISAAIEADETPYDVSYAKYLELKGKIADLTAALNEVCAPDYYVYVSEGNWQLSNYDEDGNAIEPTYFDTYRDCEKARIQRLIDEEEAAVELTEEAGKGLGFDADSELNDEAGIEAAITALDKTLKYNDAWHAIYGIYTALNAVDIDEDEYNYTNIEQLEEADVELWTAYRNLRDYNNDAYNGRVNNEIDGSDIEETIEDEDGNEQVVNYRDVIYNDEYDAIKAAADALAAEVAEYAETVKANTWEKGDADHNGLINIADYSAVRNIVLENVVLDHSDPRYLAADVNGDGVVDIADITAVAEYIMSGEWPAAAQAAGVKAIGGANTDAIELAAVGSGSKQQIVISLKNAKAYVGAQMDVQLPAGISIVGESLTSRAQGHELLSNDVDGKHRILISTPENNEFSNSEDALVVLDVEVSGNYSGGDIAVTNIKVAERSSRTYTLADVVIGGEATGIAELSTSEKIADKIYSVGGQLVNTLKKGINIIRNNDGTTKKVLVK